MDFNLQILVWLFVLPVVAVSAEYDDIECLKSIKESFEDPEKSLFSTWRFDDLTEGAICKFDRVTCWSSDVNSISELKLSGMGLVGSFPRGLGNCTRLTSLDLSHNHLFGQLPSDDISRLLPFLVILDLSSNSFSGEIPAGLANCTYLNNVYLDNNQLQGRIPPELPGLTRLKTFSVANNHLSGPVPDFPEIYVFTMYSNNSGLCGGPLPPCIAESNDEDGVKKIKFVCGFAVGWVVSALVTWFLGLFYLPNTCSSRRCQS